MKGAKQDDEAVGDKASVDKEDIGGKDTGDKGDVEQDAEEQGEQQDDKEDVEEEGEQQYVALVGKAGEEDDGSIDVDAGNKGVNNGEQEAVVDVVKRVKGGEEDEAVVKGVKGIGSTAIEGDGMVENFPSSVVALTEAEYKDIDKPRAQKQSRYLEIMYTNPMPMKTKKTKSNEEDIDIVEFTSFLKNGDQFR
ncbi:hypothetical protein QYF36_006835 [Acer negundo]|nr:hypothetical protein QYF36_006835 [Acer negundo]